MPDEMNKTETNEDLPNETMSFNDNCVIAQVSSSEALVKGIIELADKDEYVDEP